MKRFALIVIFLVLAGHSARAANCEKSREYLLGNLVGDLTLPPHTYDDLFKTCMATIGMSNVKDAYILKDGGVAKQNSIAATAATLSQFCDDYPRSTLHFLTRKELLQIKSIVSVVKISSTSSTTCQKIKCIS